MRYAVKLYTLPHRSKWTTPAGPAPTQAPGFSVEARNVDKARQDVCARLKDRGYRVRAVSPTAGNAFVAYVEEPK